MKTSLEDSENSSSVGAKLPKLEISKFQGTFLDRMRFWNPFETEIDKAKLTQVAKFSYLKELLVPSVRVSTDGLPFTTGGYERAKRIKKPRMVNPVRWQTHICNVLLDCPQFMARIQLKFMNSMRSLMKLEGSCVQRLVSFLTFEQT